MHFMCAVFVFGLMSGILVFELIHLSRADISTVCCLVVFYVPTNVSCVVSAHMKYGADIFGQT